MSDLDERKIVLEAVVGRIKSLSTIDKLIANAWKLVEAEWVSAKTVIGVIDDKPITKQDPEPTRVKAKTKPQKRRVRKLVVHGMEFPSTIKACEYFDVTKSYQTISGKISDGQNPNDLFDKPTKAQKVILKKQPLPT